MGLAIEPLVLWDARTLKPREEERTDVFTLHVFLPHLVSGRPLAVCSLVQVLKE